jgi:electron transfer flavoprotein beta subunit
MDIVVCVKNVPLTQEADLAPDHTGRDVDRDNLVYDINEWDNYAIEEAVRLKERAGGTVTAVTLGSEDDEEVLRRCLAMGADEAVRVDPGDLRPDAWCTAALLAAVVRTLPHDLILTGVQSDDLNQGVVGALMAERLGLPHAAVVNSLELTGAGGAGDTARITIELEGGQDEAAEVALPALLSIQTGINEPRYVSIMGIRRASKLEIRVVQAGGLGLPARDLQPALVVEEMYPPSETGSAEMLQGDAAAIAEQILHIVREKTGVA